MAEDFRTPDTDACAVKARRREIVKEALRQSESCLWTSTMVFIWLRRVRWQHKTITLAPIVLTALAGAAFLKEWLPAGAVAVIAFLATLIPSVAEALDVQTQVEELKRVAAEYKALQDRFRRLARITALGDVDEAEKMLAELMDRMDAVRSSSITPPQRYFDDARRQIEGGHYDFAVDLPTGETPSGMKTEPMVKGPAAEPM
ncbi:SLATT domain-containing protein [Methylobacterium sp. NEAU 140]|uniref:SLATT domain-containing protein n=1 Tax=Methylobacterium sp. NEAU 140 TaxID=3064945 RepID=UPI0027342D40|nr:SLATT domain-containing protein [Methylobacterium sp. NEAU 140]MDP4022048.1 SLATT domain-containing protein [Methylobacterium sp. NEAU 140]